MISKIYKLFSNLNIMYKLFISYFLLMSLPLLIYMFINNHIISKETENKAIYSSQQMLIQASSFIEDKINLIRNTMTAIVLKESVQKLMKQNPEKYRDNFSIWNYDMEKVKEDIFNLQPKSDILRIRLYMKGSVTDIAETDSFLNIKNVDNTDWFKMLSSGKITFEWLPSGSFTQIEKEKYISAVRRINDTNNLQELIGLIRVDIPESIIKRILTQAKYTESSVVFMINSNNDIICTSVDSYIVDPSLASFVSETYKQASSDGIIWNKVDINGTKSFVCIHGIKGTNWAMAISVPFSDILSLIRKARNNIIIIILIFAPLALPVSFFTAASATSRFRKLISHMRKMEGGDFNLSIIPSNNDEIGQLIRHFNHMFTKIAMLLDEKYQLGQEVKNKELKALQAQINPHFLYNTLDQINWLAIKINSSEIFSLVQDLSKFYKLSLSNGEDIVTVQDELELCKTYVAIQNIRFVDSVNFIVEVPQQLYDYKMPKIILQPLVENSILHGILKNISESGTIKVSGNIVDDIMTLSVEDDGIGMPDEVTQSTPNTVHAKEFHGYGIKNINERLKLLYGNDYGLFYESKRGYGTKVKVKLPAIR